MRTNLAGTGLPVGKDGSVVAIQDVVNRVLGYQVKKLGLRGFLAQHPVESEIMELWSGGSAPIRTKIKSRLDFDILWVSRAKSQWMDSVARWFESARQPEVQHQCHKGTKRTDRAILGEDEQKFGLVLLLQPTTLLRSLLCE